MFCINCGKEFKEDVKFCPECGMAQGETASKQDETINRVIDGVGKTNPLSVASFVLVILMFFFNYYGVVSYVALILAISGFRTIRKKGEKGLMLSIVCMVVSGVVSLISIMRIVEYNRQVAASYGLLHQMFNFWEYFL